MAIFHIYFLYQDCTILEKKPELILKQTMFLQNNFNLDEIISKQYVHWNHINIKNVTEIRSSNDIIPSIITNVNFD